MTPTLIFGLISSYFIVLFIISYFTGKNSTQDTFFIGNRSSPWYIVAFGMIGASVSGVTFISMPGTVGNTASINGNFSFMQVAMGYLLGYAIIALVLMPVYYRMQLTSIYGYLEERFGWKSYKTGAFFFLLSRTIGTAFRLYIALMVLQRFVFNDFGVPFLITTAITLGVIWAFTLRGGLKTIIWTDTLQTTFMLLAVLLTIYHITTSLQTNFFTAIAQSPYNQIFFWNPAEDRFFVKQFFSGMCIALAMTGLDQDLMQKNNSCATLAEGQKNVFVSSVIYFVVNFFFVCMGALLYAYALQHHITVPSKTDELYPLLALQYFPVYVGVVFIVGLVAAAYSSADSALIALTTAFCIDFLGFEKNKNQLTTKDLKKQRYLVHLSFTVLVGGLMLLFWYVLKQDVISTLFKVATFTYGPLLGLYFFGLFSNRAVNDNIAPFICIASPIICYFFDIWLTQNGMKLGFAILPINALLTGLGLFLISKKQENKLGN